MKRTLAGLLVATAFIAGSGLGASAAPGIPEGFSLVSSQQLAPGLVHQVLVSKQPPQVVNVARLAPNAEAELTTVMSNDRLSGPPPLLERTSAMCQRVKCLVGVNADFFSFDTGVPVGSAVVEGEPVHSPNAAHHHLMVARDGSVSAGAASWEIKLVANNLREAKLSGVNVPRGEDAIVMYTAFLGPTTGTNEFGVELIAETIDPPKLQVGRTSAIKLSALRAGGNSPIPEGGVVLSGHGKGAEFLSELWRAAQAEQRAEWALIRVDAPTALDEAVGGTPVLVKDGQRWFKDAPNQFVRGRHPRTIAGWNPAREIFLVTVDGRQLGHSTGMTLAEAADLMLGLGATDAINLDGGGSTTFVVNSAVVNRPSDRLVKGSRGEAIVQLPGSSGSVVGNVERPVANALVIVIRGRSVAEGATPGKADPMRTVAIAGQPLAFAGAVRNDPASVASGSLPVLVRTEPESSPLVLIALAMAGNAAVLVLAVRRRQAASFVK